jgi:DNA (cytosine-5)-methyltransferase 1
MERAGFDIKVGVDHWKHACTTYRANFPRTNVVHSDIFDFLNSGTQLSQYPDVLHLSPPCQVWSPAHTVPGRDDETNEAVLFACSAIINKLCPRVFTLEQTFGMLHDRFRPFFNVLVQSSTEHGYSLRWRVVHLDTLGLPQTRKRLVIIGACPGGKLPSFPKATHGTGRGLKPFVTVADTLARIGPNTDVKNHNPAVLIALNHPREPWNPHQVAGTITCGGSNKGHPSGNRDFTPREYALLQGFLIWHNFRSLL